MLDQPTLSVDVQITDNGVVAVLAGELDMATSGILHQRLEAYAGDHVTLDLGEVGFLDSSGIRALLILRAAAESAQGKLSIGLVSDRVDATLTIAGLRGTFDWTVAALD